MHLLFLLFYLSIETLKYIAAVKYGYNSPNKTPFVENNWGAFIQQLFLVQAVIPSGYEVTFNGPAWSISLEFYTYLLFGFIVAYLSRFKIYIFLSIALLSCLALTNLDSHSSYYVHFNFILRCLAGFTIGCCTARLTEIIKYDLNTNTVLIVLIGILCFLQFKPRGQVYELLIFFLSAALILSVVLSKDGFIKQLLRLPWFIWLGEISYSVYMSHSSILWVTNQVIRVGLKKPEALVDNVSTPQLSLQEATVASLVFIFAVLLVSHFVYIKIEKPCREYSRKIIGR